MAFLSAFDFFLVPFANVVSAVTKDKAAVLHQSLTNNLGKQLVYITICMDAAFIANILVQVAQVCDCASSHTALPQI